MSAYTPPTRTANFGAGRIALALSLILHIGATVFIARNIPPAPQRFASSVAPPYTPKTYARHADAAKSEVKKLADVANALEKIKREQAPAADNRPNENGDAKRAVKDTEDAQQAASAAQQEMKTAQTEAAAASKSGDRPRAQAATKRALAASERVQAAQAKAFLAQDRVQQELLRPSQKPTPQRVLAQTKIERALTQQAAAQSALRQAREALKQAAQAQTQAQQAQAQARAASAMQKARLAQQAANQAQAQAREPVIEQVRVARYDRAAAPAPDTHPGGAPERVIIASTRVEEKFAQAIPAQQKASVKLEEARAALAKGDRAGAKDALKAAGAEQKKAQAAQRQAQQTLKSDGATIPGEAQAQRRALHQSASAQKAAQEASNSAQKALASGTVAQAVSALKRADAAQKKAGAKQEATLAALEGEFGAKPEPSKPDPNHKHGEDCFSPGGT